jgi:UDP-2,3-diacylglucosamine pyrophosphatase LpxH
MRKKVFWSTNHSTVIQKFLRMARKGTKIIYVIGNHDIYLESFIGEDFGNISIVEKSIHNTLKNEKVLILHGHQFDTAIKTIKWLYYLGDKSYSFALFVSKWVSRIRKIFGCSYWSLSYYLKKKVKNAVKFISKFEHIIVEEANNYGVKIVCAGHIHSAEDTIINNIRYINTGCWTEYCSCAVEDNQGNLSILYI